MNKINNIYIAGTGNVPCEDCGRMFSTHSNKERHKREHCANMKLASMTRTGVGLGHIDIGQGHIAHAQNIKKELTTSNDDHSKEELKCPMCDEEFVRSVHLKRHLTSVHGIQNPLLICEKSNDAPTEIVKTEIEAEKVPPLKIKLNQNDISKSDPEMSEAANENEIVDESCVEAEKDDEEEEIELNGAPVGVIIDENKLISDNEDMMEVTENIGDTSNQDAITEYATEMSVSQEDDATIE